MWLDDVNNEANRVITIPSPSWTKRPCYLFISCRICLLYIRTQVQYITNVEDIQKQMSLIVIHPEKKRKRKKKHPINSKSV